VQGGGGADRPAGHVAGRRSDQVAAQEHDVFRATLALVHFIDQRAQDEQLEAGRRSDTLVAALDCPRRRLWRPGGIKELQRAGRVKIDTKKQLGCDRPDMPPPELAEQESQE
jgi:hypothetical protein